MADEKPLSLKRKTCSGSRESNTGLTCIVHNIKCGESDIVPLSETQMNTIRHAANKRQSQVNVNIRLDDLCASLPVEFDPELHGQHRWCYKAFTNVSRLKATSALNVVATESAGESERRSSGRQQCGGQQRLFPQDKCLFCDKSTKYLPSSKVKDKLVTCQTDCADDSIKEAASKKSDFEMIGRIAAMNLAAREARYHESCRRSYLRRDDRPHHAASIDEETAGMTAVRLAHEDTFALLCSYITEEVIEGRKVLRMSMLRKTYLGYLESKHPEHYNENYTSQKLKCKLVNHFGEQIQFWLPAATSKSELVFSSQIDVGEAVDIAFEAATSDARILQRAAEILNKQINDKWLQSRDMPWPPSASFLKTGAVSPPNSLTDFLRQTVTGRRSSNNSDRVNRLSESIAEDICSAATRAQWTMPKHILLSMSIRQLTGKEEVITILNRYGHCQSYTKVLELETAIANRIHMNDSLLPSNISKVGNVVSHLCWDNFDVNEATPSGSGTTHITHGIIVQEIDQAATETMPLTSMVKTKERSFKHVPQQLPACYSKKKAAPVITASHITSNSDNATYKLQSTEILWMICRGLYNNNARVPDWSGWVSSTAASSNESLSNIGYMTPIFNPATDSSTVQQCLMTSMEATAKISQEYTFVTFDLAMAKIAYNIVWSMPEKFKNVIIHLGGFHIMCSYMGALGKMMTGTGFEEVVVESGVCASGSINQVISGKHYNRAMRVHHHMMDAVSRLLIKKFVEQCEYGSKVLPQIALFTSDVNFENMGEVLRNGTVQEHIASFAKFMDDIREGVNGKTAQLWLQYVDCVWTLLKFLKAIKENNFQDYVASLRQLCPLLFAADRLQYARYLPLYYSQLTNLQNSHPRSEELLQHYGLRPRVQVLT